MITWRNVTICLNSSRFSGLLSQLQICWQLLLVDLMGLKIGLLLFELWHFIYLRLSTWFGMLVFFTNLSFMKFGTGYQTLFCLFSVLDGFEWFWMRSLRKNIQLILEFLKDLIFVLYISYYTLMTFLMMLSVTLAYMLMILLSTLSVMSHLICGNN